MKNIIRKNLSMIILLLVGVVGMYAITGKEKPENIIRKPKNIVLINIDTLRAQQMGTYGYNKKTTPFLDSLARGGIIFEKAITPGYLTFQTDAAIFTSLYPSQNNVRMWLTPIRKEVPTLPRILGWYGYKTAAFVSPSMWEDFGWSKDFGTYEMDKKMKNVERSRVKVAEWMKAQTEPFFLFWHIYDVHLPFAEPSKDFYPKEYGGKYTSEYIEKKMWSENWQTNEEKLSADDLEYLRASYDTGVAQVDSQLKQFFWEVEKLPTYRDTLFIISAEHGEDLGEHGYVFHGDIYEVNTRVPLILVNSGLKEKRIETTVSLLDITPTVLEWVGIPKPVEAEGVSWLPLLRGEEGEERLIYTERAPYEEVAVRKGGWKYILRNPEKKKAAEKVLADPFFMQLIKNDNNYQDELYNLESDPGEVTNLKGKGEQIEEELREAAIEFGEKMKEVREIHETEDRIDTSKLQPYP